MADESSEEVIEYFQTVIAGKRIEIECNFRDVFRNCRDYLAKFDEPDLVISRVTEEEIEKEREVAAKTDEAEGREPCHHSNGALETMAVYRKLSEALLTEGFLLFHGAAIAAGGQCFLFMAKSGTGKTTHIRKWLKTHPETTMVVNGDKPLIDINNLMVYGTPWCGKERLGTNTAVKLGGLIWLERGEANEIMRITFAEMLPCLLRQCHIPQESVIVALGLLDKLKDVPCWRLRCNMEDEAGEISYNALVH